MLQLVLLVLIDIGAVTGDTNEPGHGAPLSSQIILSRIIAVINFIACSTRFVKRQA